MADDLITIQLRLTGGTAAAAEAKKVSGAISGMGDTTTKSTTSASKSTSKFRSTLSSLGKTVAYGSIPLFGALAYEVTKSVNAYRESAKIGEQTNAVIKSTGHAAKVTADEVAKLSESLSLKTGVDDEEIQAGANMLLTFKNIRNEVGKGNDIFDQATTTITDMSSALGQDMKSSAIQLGKALNDPIAGITALSRVGVTFDEQTKKQIGRLVKQGDVLSAQKIILRELTSEFGGSAKAQHDAVDKLGVAWENLEEKLGEAVYPVLKDVTQWLTKALRQAQRGEGPLVDLKNWFEDVGDKLGPLVDLLRDFRNIIHDLSGNAIGDIVGQAESVPGVDFSGQPHSPNPITGGGHHGAQPGAPRGKVPALAPRVGQSGAGRRLVLQPITLTLDGKVVAQVVAKHALKARARA